MSPILNYGGDDLDNEWAIRILRQFHHIRDEIVKGSQESKL